MDERGLGSSDVNFRNLLSNATKFNTIFHSQIAEKNQTLTVTKENI